MRIKGSLTVVPAYGSAKGRGSGLETTVQAMTTWSGAGFQPAVDSGDLDIPVLMRHATIQGSIFDSPNRRRRQSSHMVRDVAVAAFVERVAARRSRRTRAGCRPDSQEEGMRRDHHIFEPILTRMPARANESTGGLCP